MNGHNPHAAIRDSLVSACIAVLGIVSLGGFAGGMAIVRQRFIHLRLGYVNPRPAPACAPALILAAALAAMAIHIVLLEEIGPLASLTAKPHSIPYSLIVATWTAAFGVILIAWYARYRFFRHLVVGTGALLIATITAVTAGSYWDAPFIAGTLGVILGAFMLSSGLSAFISVLGLPILKETDAE